VEFSGFFPRFTAAPADFAASLQDDRPAAEFIEVIETVIFIVQDGKQGSRRGDRMMGSEGDGCRAGFFISKPAVAAWKA
jgi:hypothetical protein